MNHSNLPDDRRGREEPAKVCGAGSKNLNLSALHLPLLCLQYIGNQMTKNI
jgi:hypothetical protein